MYNYWLVEGCGGISFSIFRSLIPKNTRSTGKIATTIASSTLLSPCKLMHEVTQTSWAVETSDPNQTRNTIAARKSIVEFRNRRRSANCSTSP